MTIDLTQITKYIKTTSQTRLKPLLNPDKWIYFSTKTSVFLFEWCGNMNDKNSQTQLTTHILVMWIQERGMQKQATNKKKTNLY